MKIDNLILINGGAFQDIKKGLRQWIDLYSSNLQDGLIFELYKRERGNHIIRVDERLDNEKFFFLVNYLKYPEGIEYKVDIEGFTIGKDKNILENQELLVYISPADKDYDNVFVVASDHKNYKVDFGGGVSAVTDLKSFRSAPNLILENPEIFKAKNKKVFQEKELVGNLEKRFKMISIIIIGSYFLNLLTLGNSNNFLVINYAIGFLVWTWLLWDYKMLQVNKYYLGALVLTIFVLLYGCFLRQQFSDFKNTNLATIGMTIPIIFLIIQRPLRFVFKGIMKREPVVDKPAPSFADFIYMFILAISTLLMPMILFS